MSLSIIITVVNDYVELNETLRSIIRTTSADHPIEIIVVDDCGSGFWLSEDNLPFEQSGLIRVLTNRHRCGVGPSRHIGALAATGDYVLFTDSHMRFTKDWYCEFEKCAAVSNWSTTLWCATCLQIDSKNMNVDAPSGEYNGATFNWYGVDRQRPDLKQIMEVVWLPRSGQYPQDGEEIPAVMGAAYFMPRSWYKVIDPLRSLRSWGGDEMMLSMKTWLCGGHVRMARNVRIAHKFPLKHEHKPFNNPMGHVLWNKVLCAWACFPVDIAAYIESLILTTGPKEEARDREACKMLVRSEWHVIAAERQRNLRLFSRDAEWLAQRFNLQLPKP